MTTFDPWVLGLQAVICNIKIDAIFAPKNSVFGGKKFFFLDIFLCNQIFGSKFYNFAKYQVLIEKLDFI